MPTNDFLPFATAAGANVSTQSDWNALAARTAGFSAGVASSAQVNKALRQAAFIAAAVAQFTADLQAGNVADDGVIANFETQLKAAIVAQAATAFTGSNQQKAVSGYQKLPGGVILQWGAGTTDGSGYLHITTPIAFPVAGVVCYATPISAVFAAYTTFTAAQSTTGFDVRMGVNGTPSTGIPFNWLAIGY